MFKFLIFILVVPYLGFATQENCERIQIKLFNTLKEIRILADAKKLNLPVQAMTGADAAKIIAHVYQASPENIAKVREITE